MHFNDKTGNWLSNTWSLHFIKTNFCSVSFRGLTADCVTTKANEMAFVVSCKNQNSIYGGKFWSRQTKFSSVIRVKVTEKKGEIQGKFDLVRVSGDFESPGFNCRHIGFTKRVTSSLIPTSLEEEIIDPK